MKFWNNCKGDVFCVLLFVVISFVYFSPAVIDGRRLDQHDNAAANGLKVEIDQYRDSHDGETPRWINSIFGGMPTYQIAPSYDSAKGLSFLEQAYHLWMPDYVYYLFISLLGFFILLRVFDFKHWMAALGAIVWAFSTYFLIIIAAGHIWKVITLAYIPPTIAGMVLCYRGKYLWGLVTTAFFAALQIAGNHVQMSYYFLIPELLIVVAYLFKDFNNWIKATGCIAVAAVIAVGLNISNLYHTYEYTKDTMRGKSELVKNQEQSSESKETDGLERDYITNWSYGVGETLSLLIPDIHGGASVPLSENKTAMKKADSQFEQNGIYGAFTQYWGEQPGTSGPVYAGALVCMLFVLALLIVPNKNPLKWVLVVSTILSILLAWGRNFMPFTDWCIDNVPMYSKFRTVSSALVVAEFTIPLLAMLGLKELLSNKDNMKANLKKLYISAGITALICIVFAMNPTIMGDCVSTSDRNAIANYVAQGYFDQSIGSSILASIGTMRAAMLTSDAWRSFFIIVIGTVLIYFMIKKPQDNLLLSIIILLVSIVIFGIQISIILTNFKASYIISIIFSFPLFCLLYKILPKAKPLKPLYIYIGSLILLCLADMWIVNKRYLNDSMFEKTAEEMDVQKTPAFQQILEASGTNRNYRVANFTVSTFNDNTTSAFFSSIGGYHAAKLRRYQELIEAHIAPEMNKVFEYLTHPDTTATADEMFPVINMMNTRWFIMPAQDQHIPVENPAAYGNAWFVDSVMIVNNANEELDALGKVSPHRVAVISKDFADQLGAKSQELRDSADVIEQTSLISDEVKYKVNSKNGGIAVFSEIYYPGWEATVDGKPAEIVRADYVLRAMNIPAGEHEIIMTFHPKSVATTETVAWICFALLILGIIALIIKELKKKHGEKSQS